MLNRKIALLFLLFAAIGARAQTTAPKRLIEFGWDEPNPSFMRQHIHEMEQTPFDGCVFRVDYHTTDGKSGNFSGAAWGKRRFEASDIQGSIDDLQATSFTKFRHNFARLNVTPGDVDWFGDYSAVVANARLVARAANTGACDGVLFDIETYARHIFDYNQQPSTSTISWDKYAAQARKRGREIMTALQDGYPDLTILTTYGYCLPYIEMVTYNKPLSGVKYGLLAPFFDGMLDAARGNARIVDGFEEGYGFRMLVEFQSGRQQMTSDVLSIVRDHDKYKKYFQAGFGLWLDNNSHKIPFYVDTPEKNYTSPAVFGQVVEWALQYSDEYVWIYSQNPRWWTDKGGPINLPQGYVDAITTAVLNGRQQK